MDAQERTRLIMEEAALRYGISANALEPLGGFRNLVYRFERAGRQYILRLSGESQRTANMVSAELDWLRYLSENGLTVARAVPSLTGNLVEVVESDGKGVPVVAFEKAPGQPPGDADWNKRLFHKMGRFLGTMHRLTRDYTPTDATHRRSEWWEDLDIFASQYLSAVDEAVQAKWREIRRYPEGLPQERDAFGLIHVDFHRGNFFVQNGELTLFDFDDCVYSWFAEDLAMALFYAIWPPVKSRENQRFLQMFFRTCLAGYREENELAERWLLEIPHFWKQREICLYMVLTALGKEQWSENQRLFMQKRRESVLSGAPYLDIPFLTNDKNN